MDAGMVRSIGVSNFSVKKLRVRPSACVAPCQVTLPTSQAPAALAVLVEMERVLNMGVRLHVQALLKEVRIRPQIQQIEGHTYFRCASI